MVRGSVRDMVSDMVPDSVRDMVRDMVGDMVRDMVRDSVGDMVPDLVGDMVGDMVPDTVRDMVRDMVGDAVRDMVGDLPGEREISTQTDVRTRGSGTAWSFRLPRQTSRFCSASLMRSAYDVMRSAQGHPFGKRSDPASVTLLQTK